MLTLNVIATCTQRKTHPIPDRLRVRDLRGGPIAERVAEWGHRLARVDSAIVPATELYAGEHWSILRSMPEAAAGKGVRVRLWICSAGYGLIDCGERIRPYGATFTPGHLDSVATDASQAKAWWAGVCNRGRRGNAPRTVTELAAVAPRTPLLVAVSSAYFDAMYDDLVAAAQQLANDDLLSIVSAGASRASPALARNLLPGDARLQGVLGGARQALNARILAHLVAESRSLDYSTARLRDRLTKLLARAPEIPVYDRAESSDDAIRAFIRRALRGNPSQRATPLLRLLRDSGRACEQSRFGRLFHDVAKESHGSPQPTSS